MNMPQKKKKIKVSFDCCCECKSQEHMWWMEDGKYFELWICYETDDPRILQKITDKSDICELVECCEIPEWCPRRKVKK
jgi:hypothetical protein